MPHAGRRACGLSDPACRHGRVTHANTQRLAKQPHLDTTPGTRTQPFPACLSTTLGVPGGTNDGPVGDCMIGGAQARLNARVTRYARYSRLLADGAYVEERPWIASTLDTLPLVDTLVRTNVSPLETARALGTARPRVVPLVTAGFAGSPGWWFAGRTPPGRA